jgi:serine/threonine protein kinase
VKQAVHKPSGIRVAIKIYEKFKLMDPAKKSSVKREIQILKKLDHSNIVKLFEVIDTPKQV